MTTELDKKIKELTELQQKFRRNIYGLCVIILFLVAGFSVGRCTVDTKELARTAHVTGFDAGVESMMTNWKDGQVFVDMMIGCECGNVLRFGSDYPYEYWPFVVDCDKCDMVYTMTREVAR